jgi:hypothetical protein
MREIRQSGSVRGVRRNPYPYRDCHRLGYFEPGVNDLHIFFGRRYSALALLLEAMQHEHRFLQFDGIDGSVGPIRIVLDRLQHSRASESLHRLAGVVLLAVLGKVQGVAEELPHTNRKSHQILFAAPNPDQRLFGSKHKSNIPKRVLDVAPINEVPSIQMKKWENAKKYKKCHGAEK